MVCYCVRLLGGCFDEYASFCLFHRCSQVGFYHELGNFEALVVMLLEIITLKDAYFSCNRHVIHIYFAQTKFHLLFLNVVFFILGRSYFNSRISINWFLGLCR